MWICNRCETYNNDDDMYCCICNAEHENRIRQEPICSVAPAFVENIQISTEKTDTSCIDFSTTMPVFSYGKEATDKVLREALELTVTEKETLKMKPKPPLKAYEPVKKSSAEIFEYYKDAGPKRFRLYYYLRRILRYSLITANVILSCHILYYICRIEGLI